MRFGLVTALVVTSASCLDLQLPPPPPPPGPGTLQGLLRYQVPGRLTALPASGARVELLQGSNAVRSDAEGRFLLSGLVTNEGVVRFTFDADADGKTDRQKLLSLAAVGAGPGRDVSLGEVLLGRNARLVGRALRADIPGDAFHLGTDVFVTGMEFSTFTADNGAYALDGLPEGPLQVSFFRENYRPDGREVTLLGGEEVRLADVSLVAAPSEAATVTATVKSTTGAAVEGAQLRAVAFSSEADATSKADGSLSLGPIPSGAYVMSLEKSGFVSVELGRRLISAGKNDLGLLVLAPGMSTPVPLDAGQRPPVPDAGAMGGGSAGGATSGGSAGGAAGGGAAGGGSAGGSSSGGSAGGGSAGGSTSGGAAGGGSAGGAGGGGAALDGGAPCEGLCGAGFFCATDDICRPSSCGLQSCEFCNRGQCFAKDCGVTACRPGDVCESGTCVPLPCAGVSCPLNTLCANGACFSTSCSATEPCPAGRVCEFGTCVDVRCGGRRCGTGTLCSDGTCYPTSTPGNPCGAGFAIIQGQCREVACEGITCGVGTQCSKGQCIAGGLYVAGNMTPTNIGGLANNKHALAAFVDGHWDKLAEFPDTVKQLVVSPDGAWLYARTLALTTPTTTLYRSQDGRNWTVIYSGTNTMNGTCEDLYVDQAGVLTASISGQQTNGLHRLMRSTDNGNTWTNLYVSPGSFGVASYAPPDFFAVKNPGSLVTEGLYRFHNPPLPDGGVRTKIAELGLDPFLLSDPTGWGPSFLAHPASLTHFLDGGLSGNFSVVRNGVLYGRSPSRQVLLLTSSAIARTFDHGVSWSFRSPAASSPNFIALARTADDAVYLANETASPPLFMTTDEGETWTTVNTDEWLLVGLHAWWNEWQPNTPYAASLEVQPTRAKANGYWYRSISNGTSGPTEPDWADAGATLLDGTVTWSRLGHPNLMRPTAMASRACTPGQQRCGAGCVDIAVSTQHCGGCDSPCATSCVAGRCLGAGTMDGGASVGCADGTREGFVDVTLSPDVAACSGNWTGDLDTSSSADALCAAGWHVCTEQDTEVRSLSTAQATAFPGCFAFRASIDGFDGCERLDCSNDVTHDDVAAVGATCFALSGVSRLPTQVPDGGACFADRGGIASQCCSSSIALAGRAAGCPQRGETGVVCCR